MDNVRTAPKKVQKKLHKTHGGVNLKKESNSKLKIIPLGGLEQIGMNITAFEYEDSIIVVDCGLAFPEDDMLGIDLVIPDITYLRDNIKKVKGFVITHGHEDHIGSLPYVLKDMNLPIYATKLTMGIIENKLKEHIDIKIFNQDTLKTLNLYNVQIGYNNAANILSDNNSFPGIDIAKFGDSINIIKKRLLLENMSVLEMYDVAVQTYRDYYQ